MRSEATALLLLIISAGCGRQDQTIRTYQAPKEPSAARPVLAAAEGSSPDAAANSAPESQAPIQWVVPAGWKDQGPQQMRFASFQVSPENPNVVLTVIPLGSAAGSLQANVNRWEQQLGSAPTSEADLPKVVQHLDVNGNPADLVDLAAPKNANPPMRMLAAIIPHGENTWFFKLAGPAEIVGAQKGNFDAFIRSIRFTDSANGMQAPNAQAAPGTQPAEGVPALPPGHPALPGASSAMPPEGALPPGHPALPGAAPQPPGNPPLPAGHPSLPGMGPAAGAQAMPSGAPPEQGDAEQIDYTVPAGWTQEEPRPMRIVSFHAGPAEHPAEVIVSQLPAVGSGSYLDNVNRWRGQVGLPPIKEGDPQPSQQIKVGGSDGTLFDFSGPARGNEPAMRMLVAMVVRGQDFVFFKMIGPADVVAQQQGAFDAFLKSVRFGGKTSDAKPQQQPK